MAWTHAIEWIRSGHDFYRPDGLEAGFSVDQVNTWRRYARCNGIAASAVVSIVATVALFARCHRCPHTLGCACAVLQADLGRAVLGAIAGEHSSRFIAWRVCSQISLRESPLFLHDPAAFRAPYLLLTTEWNSLWRLIPAAAEQPEPPWLNEPVKWVHTWEAVKRSASHRRTYVYMDSTLR